MSRIVGLRASVLADCRASHVHLSEAVTRTGLARCGLHWCMYAWYARLMRPRSTLSVLGKGMGCTPAVSSAALPAPVVLVVSLLGAEGKPVNCAQEALSPIPNAAGWKSRPKCDTISHRYRVQRRELRAVADVVVLGDVNLDIIAQFAEFPVQGQDAFACSTEFHCGGSAANTAMALAQMGIATALIARIGPDPWASKALQGLRAAGVNLCGLQRDPATMTGLMYIVVTPEGERTILGHRGANALTDPEQICEEVLQSARLFLLSGYALLDEPQRTAALRALELARQNGLTVALDPGMSGAQEARDELYTQLGGIDLLLPNLAEARQLTGRVSPEGCARALLDSGVRMVVLKLGRDGCLVGGAGGCFRVPGFAVEARDSTGAGDNFAAGLVVGFLGGLDWPGSALLGNALGAMATVRPGAGTTVLTVPGVLAFLRDHLGVPAFREYGEVMDTVCVFLTTLAKEPE